MRVFFHSLAAAVAIATSSAAQAQPQKGDLWDITSQMEMPGMPMAMPANTQRVCSPRGKDEPPFRGGREDCQITEQKKLANGWTYKMVCNDGSTIDGNITYQGVEAWSGVTNMKMKEGVLSVKTAAKRVGECDYKASVIPSAAKK